MSVKVKRILVPIDFSPDSLNALAYAHDFAKIVGAELVLLHVVEPFYLFAPSEMYAITPDVSDVIDEHWRFAETELRRLVADLKKHGQRSRIVVKRGTPSQVIVDTAKRTSANLIIMGTHGHTGLAHMLIGSVAERVVRTAHCAVLTVRYTSKRHPKPKKATRQGGKRPPELRGQTRDQPFVPLELLRVYSR
jgi:universal stress protein A